MKITDGIRTVRIRMYEGISCDCSLDFYEAGGLPYDEITGVYTVPDVDYCIDQANEWAGEQGPLNVWAEPECRIVIVEEV